VTDSLLISWGGKVLSQIVRRNNSIIGNDEEEAHGLFSLNLINRLMILLYNMTR